MSMTKKFREDEKGVSVVIGAVLLFAIMVTMYTTIQVAQVPAWNKEIEYNHQDVVYSDMMFLKSDIENAAMLETPKSSNIHMGVRYPNRMIFINPGVGVAGLLTVDNDVKIRINYTVNAGSLYTNYSSSRIIYEAHGTINSPKLVYEHGIIIRDWGTANITTDEQSLIVNDEIYIPIVNGTSSRSSMETESLEIKPFSETNTIKNIKYVNITMDTNYPEVWRKLLADANTSYTTAFVSDNKIIINSSATRHIVFPTEQPATGLHAGMIKFSTSIIPEPGYTNIDPTKQNWPSITNISIKAVGTGNYKKTHSNITATVKNVTAPDDIHADLSDLTKDPLQYDVQPDYSSTDDINAVSWDLPNNNTVKWNTSHPDYNANETVAVKFWVVNTKDNMQFYTTRVFVRQGKHWL